MNLSFKEWFLTESKRKVSVQSGMKQWVNSVENLEKELEILKTVLKNKKDKEEKLKTDKKKDLTQKINVLDKKLDTAKDKKPEEHELPTGKDQSPKPIRPVGEYSSLRKKKEDEKKDAKKPDDKS